METFDVIVIGAGHAGVEAALASSRLHMRTLLLTLSIDSVAFMPCNPSVGGTGKGHLVREVDALGGQMGIVTDAVSIQSRMLGTSKGAAVHSLRAQADKAAYHHAMLAAVLSQKNLTVRQGECASVETVNGRIAGIVTATGRRIGCAAVVVAAGVYLSSDIIIGEYRRATGPSGFANSAYLSDALRNLGFELRRFKTGTPARILGSTIDFAKLEPQEGDASPEPFSFMTDTPPKNLARCYLTYTNERTHEIIRANLHRAPMYNGGLNGTGARYCPSIEDKVVRFADKPRHQIFLEPEGLASPEWYVQGVSTSLPEDVQIKMYRSIAGLENANVLRLAYAIEYDVIDARRLDAAFHSKDVRGLFFAGQINGTSGYEEAAAQGIVAGMNAALHVKGEPPFVIRRDEGYIGVLADDITVKGTDEPYRMMTSRCELRLLLRQDNADIRLTERAAAVGLATEPRLCRMTEKKKAAERTLELLREKRLVEYLRRPEVSYAQLASEHNLPDIPPSAARQVELTVKYEGYLEKQRREAEKIAANEDKLIPQGIIYEALSGLRTEAKLKLKKARPTNLGQAARIPGVNPADVAVLSVIIKKGQYKADA
ncbi:MAG: tRNA uridine-5-carboxymethylaminomethyl(34) synthesis enzyme MnmG [Oscillospiraceae bacterium]|jgi:tRNA uridine 5-carboxymethylaminomethyl modification enzyme|nr:tRNA uridine-5-carboxymethylaminomethyl(34) synthesis enzyme MnmG [Oscillospiraceae bacterium]